MKVMFVCPPGDPSSADFLSEHQVAAIPSQIFGIATALRKYGVEPIIVRHWFKKKECIEIIEGVHIINVPLRISKSKGYFSRLPLRELGKQVLINQTFGYEVKRAIKKLKPDIIHFSTVLSGLPLRNMPVPKVYITHNNDILFTQHDIRTQIRLRLFKVLVKNCSKVVALTESVKELLRTLGIRCDAVIPNGIWTKDYHQGEDGGYILYAGRFVAHKQIGELIDAYALARERYGVRMSLVLLGDGPEKPIIEKKIKSHGLSSWVELLPFQPKPKYRDILANCSFFVFPSRAEAFGVVIVEAMASGKPVIACDIPGPKDIIKHLETGLLYQPDGPAPWQTLAKYMALLAHDEEARYRMGRCAREIAVNKFDFEVVALQYVQLYNQVFN